MGKEVQDSTDNAIGMSVTGVDIASLRESARLEAAKIWSVPSSRVKVHLTNIHVGSRDPFPGDLSTYAAVNLLIAHAKCIITEDPNTPDHERI